MKAAQCSGHSRQSTADSTHASATGSTSAEAGTRSLKQDLRHAQTKQLQQRDQHLGASSTFSAQNELYTHYQDITCSALRSMGFFYLFSFHLKARDRWRGIFHSLLRAQMSETARVGQADARNREPQLGLPPAGQVPAAPTVHATRKLGPDPGLGFVLGGM